MKKIIIIGLIALTYGCTTKDKYDVSKYYDVKEQDEQMASIITHLFTAPTYVSMKDRFKPEHRSYYSALTSRYKFDKYFVTDDSIHYFYVIRPTSNPKEKRGVGGHFKLKGNYELIDFHEEFVTPLLPEEEVKGRCAFLFDEMVKGNLAKYINMSTYVQWPNAVSYYDTITYEWKMKPGFESVEKDSIVTDSISLK